MNPQGTYVNNSNYNAAVANPASAPPMFGNPQTGYSTDPNKAVATAQSQNNTPFGGNNNYSVGTYSMTPVSYTPSVGANQLQNIPQTLDLPQPGLKSSDTIVSHVIGTAQADHQAATDYLNSLETNASQGVNDVQARLDRIQNHLAGKGADQLQMESDASLEGLRKAAKAKTQAYLKNQLVFNNEYATIVNNPGMTEEGKAQAISALQRSRAYDLANQQLDSAATSGNVQDTQAAIDRTIALRYADDKDQLDYWSHVLDRNEDKLSKAQQEKISMYRDDAKNAMDEKVRIGDLGKEVAKNPNATSEQISRVVHSGSYAEAVTNAGELLRTSKWAAVPFGTTTLYDPITGEMKSVAGTGGGVGDLKSAIVDQESGGSYSAVNKDSGALGKYQMMPSNLGLVGLTDTPENRQLYLNTPGLQDMAYGKLIDQLTTKYGGDQQKIVAAYYGGDGAAQVVGTPAGDKPQKGGYPSVNQYVSQVLSKLTQGNTEPSPAATNQSYTNSSIYQGLSTSDKSTVAALLNYTADPKSLTTRGGYNQTILNKVRQIDPNFDETKYTRVQDIKKQFSSGTESDQISAANTALGHLQELKNNFDKLGNSNNGIWNQIANTTKNKVSSPEYKAVQQTSAAVAEELKKIYAASGGTGQEYEDFKNSINPNMTPAEQTAVIQNAINLIFSKTKTLSDKYKNVTGEAPQIFAPDTQQIIRNFGLDPTLGEGDGTNGEMVTIQTTDGRVGTIPKANLEAAKKLGAKQI